MHKFQIFLSDPQTNVPQNAIQRGIARPPASAPLHTVRPGVKLALELGKNNPYSYHYIDIDVHIEYPS